MNNTGAPDAKGYAIARGALFDALLALAPLPPNSFVLVGAQAVYLRAPEGVIPSIAPFTLDGDLVADPLKIRHPRLIIEHLERGGFSLRGTNGLYVLSKAPLDEQYAARVDIFVPASDEHKWEIESYSTRDASAIFVQPGLELALVDHSPMEIRPIDTSQPNESITVEVAGTLALLIAKGWKIHERFEQGPEAFRDVVKDITDVYRLLRSSKIEELHAAVHGLPPDRNIVSVAQTGAAHLRKLCRERGPAIRLLSETLGTVAEVELIAESLEALVDEFCALVEESLKD